MKAPVTYEAGFVADPASLFNTLWSELDWERRGSTPRREFYCNDVAVPYTYGSGAGVREYLPKEWHPALSAVKAAVESRVGAAMEVCFLNGYEDARDHLGWHADDSPEMDDERPIAIVTVGAEREIWFRPNSDTLSVEKLLLESGSLCVMKPGMQDTHMHRIPKAGFICGPRISMTFRGYVRT
ncbi:alpha-ketoglutarate-dependent dioxygenase AlkB [Methylibium petroleiphilum]|uniref:DNA-N1-methyladenine dioxygenase n=1 Tax=Methylibium petroleiphilum (strain ATCC BAA-1232 / LMG 22953 / PM1) TaxID=420662 RepID=A2SND0_METPP|nr:alpha-ketoglutarate-dependent dioxygenase AlkB [Methylibium petroleiphilum]ABM97069.1 DNA-N1-methyladenine dioxygenase [Methylibium petroleiphilum PM1]